MPIPEWLAIVILGIIEGITEFLPISSTGHLLIAEKWLPRQTDLFNIVIQSAAVLAVIPLFKDRIKVMLAAGHDLVAREYALKVMVAFGITGVGGLILEKLHFKLPEKLFPVGMALLIGGVAILLIESRVNDRRWKHEVTWKLAVIFGLGQLVAAIFPGASRSGTTIMLALLFGMSRPAATEFSFWSASRPCWQPVVIRFSKHSNTAPRRKTGAWCCWGRWFPGSCHLSPCGGCCGMFSRTPLSDSVGIGSWLGH